MSVNLLFKAAQKPKTNKSIWGNMKRGTKTNKQINKQIKMKGRGKEHYWTQDSTPLLNQR